jgi:tetratricopeptide (TPR) repeat protein
LTIYVMLTVVSVAYAQHQNPFVRSANRLYKERKYDKALPEYMKAKEVNSNDPVLNFNLGDAFYRSAKFEEAAGTFNELIGNSDDNVIKQKSYYNQGVALTRQNKLEESIDAYKMAVKMDPADQDARINLQKALLELKKKVPPPPEKKEEKQKKQEKKDQQKQPPQSKLTKKQVEQLLRALQQREQQVQQKMQQRHRTAGQQEKDW